MTLMILLFAAGILLLGVEVIVPGGILGAIGGLLMLAASAMAYVQFGAGGGTMAVTLAIALALLAILIEIRVLPASRLGRRVYLSKQITGVSAALGVEARDLIGQAAVAQTMLSPSGYVQVNGHRYEAFCQAGQVPVGAALVVIGADNFRLIVTPPKPPQHHV